MNKPRKTKMPAELPDRNFECGRARRAKKSLRVRGPVGLGFGNREMADHFGFSLRMRACALRLLFGSEGGVQTKYLNGVVLLIALI